jgi:hypothetical protein
MGITIRCRLWRGRHFRCRPPGQTGR